MSTDENQPVRAELHDEKYESTVLDFLDKEIAAVQPLRNQKNQSEDLDTLVSDLMKQVITESLQSEASPQSPVPPQQSEPAPKPRRESRSQARPAVQVAHESQTQTLPVQATQAVAPQKKEPARAVEKTPRVPAPVLLKPRTKPRWLIPAITFASLCLLASIGVVLYRSGPAGKVPAAQNAPVTAAAPSQAAVTPSIPQTAAPVSNPSQTVPESIKPPQPETKPAGSAKTTEIPVPAAHKSSETRTGQGQKTRAENPPGPPAAAGVVPAIPAVVERTPAPAPASAVPETSSLINGSRREERPLGPIPSKVESISASIAPAGSNARQMIAAMPISQTTPSYPELAVRTRAAGSVVLDLNIDAQGKVVKATPVSGPTIFYNAAISAAMKWRYRPASINGTSVQSQSRVTMVFNLKK